MIRTALEKERMNASRLAFALATLLLTSCSGKEAPYQAGDGSGPADESGAAVLDAGIDGFPFATTYAISLGIPGTAGAIQVLVSNKANRCDSLKATFFEPGMTSLDLYVTPPTSSSEAGVVIAPLVVPSGTYTLGDADAEFSPLAVLHVLDSQCHDVVDSFARSGTITLTATTPRVAGAFDVAFDEGRVAGRFDAAPCILDAGAGARCAIGH
jgi:hypothetical protein